MSLLRVDWLEAKIRAGLGHREEAMGKLEKVCDEFTARRHPYDAALSALDLAQLKLEAGLSKEVKWLAARMDQSTISNIEMGYTVPDDATLQRMAREADVPWHVVVLLRRFYAAALAASDRWKRAGAPPVNRAVLDVTLLALTPYLLEEAEAEGPPLAELLREAEAVWAVLEPLPEDERRRRIETAPAGACRSWAALTRALCEASERVAAESAEEAQSVARLALLAAGRVEDSAAKSHAWGYLANARRVANDFDGADEAFARAWKLWPGIDTELFAEWRLHDLDASLRREQHRWPEALERLDRARTCSGNDRLAASRILLKKEHVLEEMGDFDAALAVLEEAAPLVETLEDPRLLFALRFNAADNLARLERYKEAARLMPEVHEIAAGQVKGLEEIRLLWLDAKVKAGTGKKEEAMADLEKVRDAFATEELPYDAGLAGLDLSVLWLEAGRTAEVRELAEEMAWIFVSKKIGREALASLSLFVEAAKQEAATVELARRVIGEVEKARRSGD